MTDQPETCQTDTWNGYRSYPCGRPVKRNGMCGIHAAALERRERNDERWRQEFAAKEARAAEARAKAPIIAARLARHGIEVEPSRWDGRIALPDAEALADILDQRYPDRTDAKEATA